MKIWKISALPLTKKQEAERMSLGLPGDEYRLYDFIRRAGHEGVSWGSLPHGPWSRLAKTGLIRGTTLTVWTKEYAP